MKTDNVIIISILIAFLSFCGDPSLHEAVILNLAPEPVIATPVDDNILTLDDVQGIYSCVDTKIHNSINDINFPCIAIRGDTF